MRILKVVLVLVCMALVGGCEKRKNRPLFPLPCP